MRDSVVTAAIVEIVLTAFAAVETNNLHSSTSYTNSRTITSLTEASQRSTVAGETIFIHVVNSTSGESIADASVLAGPASSATDISFTLDDSYTIDECIHEVPSGAVVSPSQNVVVSNSTTTTLAACPLKNYSTNATGWVTISNQNATYFFIQPTTPQQTSFPHAQVITIEGSQTYVTAPCPEGNLTVSSAG